MRRDTIRVIEYGRHDEGGSSLLRVRYSVSSNEYECDEDWPEQYHTDEAFDARAHALEVAERDWLHRSAFRRADPPDSPAMQRGYAEFARMMLSQAPWRSDRVYYLAGKALEGAIEAGYDFPHSALELLELLAADRKAYRDSYEKALADLDASRQAYDVLEERYRADVDKLEQRLVDANKARDRALARLEAPDLEVDPMLANLGDCQSPPAARLSAHFTNEAVERGTFPNHIGPDGPVYDDE